MAFAFVLGFIIGAVSLSMLNRAWRAYKLGKDVKKEEYQNFYSSLWDRLEKLKETLSEKQSFQPFQVPCTQAQAIARTLVHLYQCKGDLGWVRGWIEEVERQSRYAALAHEAAKQRYQLHVDELLEIHLQLGKRYVAYGKAYLAFPGMAQMVHSLIEDCDETISRGYVLALEIQLQRLVLSLYEYNCPLVLNEPTCELDTYIGSLLIK